MSFSLPAYLTVIRLFTLAFAITFVFVQPVLAETRAALVIGNSAYEYSAHLPNAASDASDIGDALERIGFDVTRGMDLEYREMRLLLRDFARQSRDAEMTVIYYAGHGIEIDNTNYLVPTNAELRSDQDIEFEAVRLDALINAASNNQGLKLVLVDACRNNPFLSSMVRTSATRSMGRGLARIDPGGVLVGYAARSGTLALDGDGRNSPYAQAILEHIEEPGLELGKMFRKVRDKVFTLTDGYQEPFTYGSLPGKDIFLVPTALKPEKADGIAEAFSRADELGTRESWQQFVESFSDQKAHPLYTLALRRQSGPDVAPSELRELIDERDIIDDELTVFAAAEKIGSPRAWALYFERFPFGRMRRSALLQEDVAFMSALRDRVWGRYRNAFAGQEMTREMRIAALEMIRIDERQITRIQNALVYREIDIGGIDGQLGPRTMRGLESFQRARGISNSGLPTRPTLAALAQINGWGTSGGVQFGPDILPTSGPIARIPDPEAIRILEQDPRLDRLLAAFPGREIVYGFFEGRLYAATNLGTTFGRSDLSRIEKQSGGRLLEIGSAAEEAFIRELVRFDQKLWGTTSVRSSLGPAIGLKQSNGRWAWRSGDALSYTNWVSGEPKRLPEGSALDDTFGRLVPRGSIAPNQTTVDRMGWATSATLSPIILLEIE